MQVNDGRCTQHGLFFPLHTWVPCGYEHVEVNGVVYQGEGDSSIHSMHIEDVGNLPAALMNRGHTPTSLFDCGKSNASITG